MRGANNRQTTIQRMRAIKRASKSIQYRKEKTVSCRLPKDAGRAKPWSPEAPPSAGEPPR